MKEVLKSLYCSGPVIKEPTCFDHCRSSSGVCNRQYRCGLTYDRNSHVRSTSSLRPGHLNTSSRWIQKASLCLSFYVQKGIISVVKVNDVSSHGVIATPNSNSIFMLSEAIPQVTFYKDYVDKAFYTCTRQRVYDKSSVTDSKITVCISSACINFNKQLKSLSQWGKCIHLKVNKEPFYLLEDVNAWDCP